MIIEVDSDYNFELPADHTATIIAGIADDGDCERIQSAIDATESGEPVRLPVQIADVLLNAYAEWEREGDD